MLKRVGVALALSVLVSTALNADGGQKLSISKKLTLFNSMSRSAANAKTGDVVVTWRREDFGKSSFDAQLYTALCKKQKNGNYSISKAQLVSDKKHDCEQQDISYNPKDNSFLVVWQAYYSDKKTKSSAWGIFARKLDGKGRAKGKVLRVTDSEFSGLSPVVQYLPTIKSVPPASKGFYLVVFCHAPPAGSENYAAGLYAVIVDHDGKVVGDDPALVMEPKGSDRYYSDQLLRAEDGTFALAATRSYNNGEDHQATVFKLAADGKYRGHFALANYESSDASVIQLKSTLFLASWRKQNEWIENTANKLLRKTLKPKGKEFTILKDSHGQYGKPVKLGADDGAFEVFAYSTLINGRYIQSSGKLAGDAKYLTSAKNSLVDLDAICLPGSNEVLITWSERSGKKAQVNGYITTVK